MSSDQWVFMSIKEKGGVQWVHLNKNNKLKKVKQFKALILTFKYNA